MLADSLVIQQTIDQKNLVINRPDLQKPGSKIWSRIFTLVFWFLWVSIWLPVFEVINYYFEIEIFYDYFNLVDKKMLVYNLFSLCVITAISIISVIFFWSIVRLLRFGNKKCRRNSAPLTDPHNLSAFFNIPETNVSNIQRNRKMMFNFDNDGKIKNIKGDHTVIFHSS